MANQYNRFASPVMGVSLNDATNRTSHKKRMGMLQIKKPDLPNLFLKGFIFLVYSKNGYALVRPIGFEPTTSSSARMRSIQLSYGRSSEST